MTKPFGEGALGNSNDLLEVVNKLQLAVDASRMGIWEYDEGMGRVHWDDRMLEIYGIADQENERPDDFWERQLHPEDRDDLIAYAAECRRTNTDFKRDYRIIRQDGAVRYIRSLARTVSAPGEKNRSIGVNIDVTEDYLRAKELEHARNQLRHDARHDALTGLGNRRWLDETMIEAFNGLSASDSYCLVLLDLDHFKDVNDGFGHLAGDFVLKSVADILVDTIGDAGQVFRVGGDEFAAFFPAAPAEDVLAQLCDHLVSKISAPIDFEGADCFIGVSIGYAIGMGAPDNPANILSDADAALYAVKRNGRGGHQAYRPELQRKAAKVSNSRADLMGAMSRGELTCFLQPQYDAHTLEIVGAEALVRWNCPQRGVLRPEDFFPGASQRSLTAQTDEHVFGIIARQQSTWAKADIPYPRVSVNTCAERLNDPNLIAKIKPVLRTYHRFAFELPETAFFGERGEVARDNLAQLRRLGIRVALGDFGSGRSSVPALQAVKPDEVKINGSLVAHEQTSPQHVVALQALSRIVRLEAAKIVVQGLESGIQLAAVRDVDCDALQGCVLQRPVPIAEFPALLGRTRRPSVGRSTGHVDHPNHQPDRG